MEIIVIGLGKMGLNLVKNYNENRIAVRGYDLNETIKDKYHHELFEFVTLDDIFSVPEEKLVLMLLPAGDPTSQMIDTLATQLSPLDYVIDFSNSFYQTSIKNHQTLKSRGIRYCDCGLSGGMNGAKNGACMMLGGSNENDGHIHRYLEMVCQAGGFQFYEQVGSGHYLKMVHNGIEYGMMQAIAEGLSLLDHQPLFDYNLEKVANNWLHGSIIESSLLKNIYEELQKDTNLAIHSPKIAASGEANWMVKEAIDSGVPVPIIALSLMMRQASLTDKQYSNRVVSAMRYNFGGHNEFSTLYPEH
ncbi:MAG: NADP-dependent phosphogluconate dehydrogenase [Aerococcaceae bacterium]|nr:NADP-dependent phosphogluconate dehydrogenase [Aerococcaceae bacterium]